MVELKMSGLLLFSNTYWTQIKETSHCEWHDRKRDRETTFSTSQFFAPILWSAQTVLWTKIERNSTILQQGKDLPWLKGGLITWWFVLLIRDATRVKNPGGPVVMRRAAAVRRCLLICQNLGGPRPPRPPRLLHACYISWISWFR